MRSPCAGLLYGTQSAAGNPRLPSTPLAASRLRMTSGSDFIVHLALLLGKCQNKVQLACIIGTVLRVGTIGPGLSAVALNACERMLPSCLKCAVPRFAAAN